MSRRGNCHDNAVAESFFQLLKRERIKRKIYTTRQDARDDVFDYIEMFYNPKRRHSFNNQPSPVEFEKRYAASLESVYKTRGDSLFWFARLEKANVIINGQNLKDLFIKSSKARQSIAMWHPSLARLQLSRSQTKGVLLYSSN